MQNTQSQNSNTNTPKLAVVIPCYNEEKTLQTTHTALTQKIHHLIAQKTISPESYICYIDDGSKDNTYQTLSMIYTKSQQNTEFKRTSILTKENLFPPPPKNRKSSIADSTNHNIKFFPNVYVIKLSRNFGHQNALLAGLHFVSDKCDCAISIDADLQDDINIFDDFLKAFKTGKEIIYGIRKQRATDTFFKRNTALVFYRCMQMLGVEIIYNHADYRLLSARSIHALLEFKEVNLFLRGIIPLIGFSSDVVEYDRHPRVAGESKYTLKKMLSFAWNGITSFSIMPLRFVSVIGFAFFLLSIILGGYVLFVKFITYEAVYGWTSTIMVFSFFSGVQMLSLGIIGEYIGKIYQETKGRPRYCIDQILA